MTAADTHAHILIVRMWVAPEAEQQLLDWLQNGHLEEVVSQPGFKWAKLVALTQTDRTGWRGYANISSVDSGANFASYEADLELKERFTRERSAFDHLLRVERADGHVLAEFAPVGSVHDRD